MFTEITMLNYSRPLAERAKSRKVVGPYRWRPTQAPSKGRGFYAGRDGQMDSHGATLRLRIVEANDCLPSYSRTSQINGYFCDNFQDRTLQPIVLRLPKSRGFLAGWTMGAGMCGSFDCDIFDDAESAAFAAHSMAEYAAEEERNYHDEDEDEDQDEDDLV